MGKPDHEHEVEDATPGLAEIRSAYARIRREEPPALVDLAILNRARRETSEGKSKTGKFRVWVAGLSTAALLVVTVSLSLQLKEESSPLPEAAEPAATLRDELDLSEQAVTAPDADTFSSQGEASDRATSATAEQLPRADEVRKKELGVAQKAANSPPSEAEATTQAADTALLTPELWLQRIQELQQRGLIDEATLELERLQAAYPEYPLPQELLRALGKTADQ